MSIRWRKRMRPGSRARPNVHALPSQPPAASPWLCMRASAGMAAKRNEHREPHLPPQVSEDAGSLRRRHGGLASYGLAVEPMWRLEVTRYGVTPPNWPRGLPLSIGVIADVHAGGPAMPAERIRGIVEETNALGADTVVLLGDFAASHKFKTRPIAPEIGPRRWPNCGPPSACTPCSATTTGGTIWRPSALAGPVLGRRMLESEWHTRLRERRRAPGQGRAAFLARRPRRPDRLHSPPPGRGLAQLPRRRRSRRHAGQGHRRRPPSSCSRTSPTSSRACRPASR